MQQVDAAIVGAGVLGLAVAAELAREGRTVVVLESNPRYGMETSSRNSEVVHAGLYYPPDSLKSRLCHQGRKMLYDLCPKAGIFIRKTGKLVVAVEPSELESLRKLKEKAQASGAEGLRLLDARETRRRVGSTKALGALWSPETGIIDSEELMGYFYARAQDQGAIILFNSKVENLSAKDGGYQLNFGQPAETIQTKFLINAAGLHADRLARDLGIDIEKAGYKLRWCKGSYFRLKRKLDIPHLIYPMPATHGLGIHLTLDRQERIRFGPDTEFVDRIDYAVDSARAAGFVKALSRYMDGIGPEDLVPDTAGIRPKLASPDGSFRDFVIAEESSHGLPGLINLIGIESPGLTASPAIAKLVASFIN